ncbi:MAG: arylsulfatase [Opitutales bacterium]
MRYFIIITSLFLGALGHGKPNVVFVLTDDQGYGDIAHHGNPIAITPHLDALARESVSLTDYHVSPTCSPSRASIMTGRWANRTGVWHTIRGRSTLRREEVTVADVFQANGYATGLFGKWHLGDVFPYRPQDRGFTEVFMHAAGGVGQASDFWDNSYFDDTYFHNGVPVKTEGFCTDVFFEAAKNFIDQSTAKDQPFFAYIATNAPHGPLHAPQEYIDMYPDEPIKISTFYAMVTNIDSNVGALRQHIRNTGIEENTIFIFSTDNGTNSGYSFKADMRGKKGSQYDGGHRVPFFIYYPKGGLMHRKEVPTLTHAVDLLPTLVDLCGLQFEGADKVDGVSILPLLKDQVSATAWRERMVISDSQRVVDPVKWRASAVMSQGWRLINGTELYHIDEDPGQKNDISNEFPERVESMRAFYEQWWAELEPTFDQDIYFVIGNPLEPMIELCSVDSISASVPWKQSSIRAPKKFYRDAPGDFWYVEAEQAGRYRVSLRRWPKSTGAGINATLPAGENVPGADKAFRTKPGVSINAEAAELLINGELVAKAPVQGDENAMIFELEIPEGKMELSVDFLLKNGKRLSAPFVEIEHL